MSPPKRRAEGSAQGPAWPPLLWLAAMLGLVCIAVIETSAAPAGLWRLISGSGEPAPLAPVIIAGAALLVQPLLALDRRFGLLSIWLVRSDVSPVKRAPVLDAALTLACLAAVLLMLSLALGQPPQDFPRLSHFSSPVDIALFDGFHEGEVLGGFPIAVDHAPLPLLIHGPGKNLLPGALAAHFAEPGYGIAFMRLIEGAGRMLTVLMVAAAAATASASLLPAALPRSQRLILAAAPGLVATLGVLTFALPTNRQILLLAGLAVGVAMVSRAGRADGAPVRPAFALGALAGVAPLHIYSAAVELVLVAVAAGIAAALRNQRAAPRIAAAGIAGAAVAAGTVLLLGGAPLYMRAGKDILYWVGEGRGIWSVPTTEPKVVIGVVMFISALGFLAALTVRANRSSIPSVRDQAAVYGVLAAGLFAASRNFIERSDWPHLGMALVTGAVILGALAAPMLYATFNWRPALARTGVAGIAALGLVLGSVDGAGPSIRELIAALETPDSDILPEDVRAFAERYADLLADQDCLLVLTNEGVLNYATGLPPCGEAFYPVYLSTPAGDTRLAAWLEVNPQRIVVIGTSFWSDKIDGRPMAGRLPRTFDLLDRTMGQVEEVEGRVFWLANPR